MQLFYPSNVGLLLALYALFWLVVLATIFYIVRTVLVNQRRAIVAQEQVVELLREQNNLIRQSAGRP